MFFSVIIPTYKRHDSLSLCLKHLEPHAQILSSDLFEVIVTDDALDDAPLDFLEKDFPWVRHLPGPQKGPAANRNNGARAARGEWLIFLDDDCLPQPSFLSAYHEAIQKNPDYRVFEGCTRAERRQLRLDEEAPINDQGGYLWSCNFAIKQALFSEMGGFCELYPYACMEDVDFREQLKERTIDFLFVPEAIVIHPWRFMAPEDKVLNMLLVSHSIFYQRYPMRKPSMFTNCRTIVRAWVLGLFWEAPNLRFRGGKHYFERQTTLTRFLFRMGQSEAEYHVLRNPRGQIPTRPGDA